MSKNVARSYARQLDSSTIALIADSLVWGDFDWRDWFDDKPSTETLRAFQDEVMQLDELAIC